MFANSTTRTPTTYPRAAVVAMYGGLVLTVATLAVPYVDRATTNLLASHIRSGYPAYSAGRTSEAVTLWLTYLSVLGALGIGTWLLLVWAARRGKAWTPWAASAALVTGGGIALFNLVVRDTSGDTGLPPLLGLTGLLPAVAGVVAVTLLWRHSRSAPSGR